MSQAFSLYTELTIRQNLMLHARLFDLPPDSVDADVLDRLDGLLVAASLLVASPASAEPTAPPTVGECTNDPTGETSILNGSVVDCFGPHTGETIYIAGDFQGWNPRNPAYALARQPDGRWTITLPLPAGVPIQTCINAAAGPCHLDH